MRNLFAALAVCFAVPAFGQSMVQAGSDTIELREPTPDCHCIALLVYSNGISSFSQGGDYTVTRDGIEIQTRIEVSGGPETFIVYGFDSGYMVLDENGEIVERIEVIDGEVVTLTVLPPMF